MSKKDNKNPNVNQNVEQSAQQSNKQEDSKVLELTKTIESLSKDNEQLKSKLASYESQIKVLNEEYVKKVSEKAKQAADLIDQKTNEIKQKLSSEYNTKSKYALEKTAEEIIHIVNQFELALSHEPSDPKILNYQKGFKMFLTMLKTLLSNMNVNEISVNANDEFDPTFMECFETQHSETIANNKVIRVIKKGYKLHERVIVPTLVVVCKKAN